MPRELEERLAREARLTGTGRSEVARQALDRYLDESEKERFLRDMRRAARELRGDPETRAVQEEFAQADAEALEIAEGSAADRDAERWWD
jgi:metal-responsive CopG/Arc/MetJ family transcriptional regulator